MRKYLEVGDVVTSDKLRAAEKWLVIDVTESGDLCLVRRVSLIPLWCLEKDGFYNPIATYNRRKIVLQSNIRLEEENSLSFEEVKLVRVLKRNIYFQAL